MRYQVKYQVLDVEATKKSFWPNEVFKDELVECNKGDINDYVEILLSMPTVKTNSIDVIDLTNGKSIYQNK